MNTLIRYKMSLVFVTLIFSSHTFAFDKLKNGFETITNTYLLPLTGVVAGCALITFITLSYFKQEEYQKKAASVIGLSIFSAVGLSLIKTIIESFS